ncbi:hypothetical protein FB45DRAFT_340682 [Roridomyces roridus]|uniref:Uncharacterized protein n=1 Tax=Roridomyces roridus TaxID=1738132 RepID=A0AAD7FB64_9AGAR|nr:hypothetical protein FB45DRAFT_340682 [Roridomyces roridus]
MTGLVLTQHRAVLTLDGRRCRAQRPVVSPRPLRRESTACPGSSDSDGMAFDDSELTWIHHPLLRCLTHSTPVPATRLLRDITVVHSESPRIWAARITFVVEMVTRGCKGLSSHIPPALISPLLRPPVPLLGSRSAGIKGMEEEEGLSDESTFFSILARPHSRERVTRDVRAHRVRRSALDFLRLVDKLHTLQSSPGLPRRATTLLQLPVATLWVKLYIRLASIFPFPAASGLPLLSKPSMSTLTMQTPFSHRYLRLEPRLACRYCPARVVYGFVGS